MAKVRVVITNPSATAARLEDQFWGRAWPQLREQEMSDCNTYVRRQDGILADSVRVEGRSITWNTHYAKKVYYTGTPRRNKNPNASLRWCEVAKRKHAKDWAELASKLVNGG